MSALRCHLVLSGSVVEVRREHGYERDLDLHRCIIYERRAAGNTKDMHDGGKCSRLVTNNAKPCY